MAVETFSNDVIRDLLEKAVMETMGSCEEIVREWRWRHFPTM